MPNLERNLEHNYEIDSIIPAAGWKARFQGESGASEEQLLICWALCNFEDNHDENAKEIIGIALRNGKKVLCDCNEAFVEYVPPMG
ncbi:MAG: hypothetical protein V7731_21360 [Amphritea sp.]